MKKRSFGKLQLNRETLRNLDTGELGQVAGGITSNFQDCTAACGGNSNASGCNFACEQTATCGCTGLAGGTCGGDVTNVGGANCNSGMNTDCCTISFTCSCTC